MIAHGTADAALCSVWPSATRWGRRWKFSRPTHASPQFLSACAYFGLVLAGLLHGLGRKNLIEPILQRLIELDDVRTDSV